MPDGKLEGLVNSKIFINAFLTKNNSDLVSILPLIVNIVKNIENMRFPGNFRKLGWVHLTLWIEQRMDIYNILETRSGDFCYNHIEGRHCIISDISVFGPPK